MKIKKVISLLCTAAMLLAVPAGNVYAGAEDQSVVVTMPTTSEPESGFDPAYGWGAGEHVHEPLIQSTLVRTTKDLGIENDLATEYSCSDDGLTWTVKIRDDVKFTDGEPLTASDVAFTFNTLLELLQDINQKFGITIVISTHQMSVVREICTHVAIMKNGEVKEQGLVEEIFSHPKSQVAKELISKDSGNDVESKKLTQSEIQDGEIVRIVRILFSRIL